MDIYTVVGGLAQIMSVVNLCVCIIMFLTVQLLPQWVGSVQQNVGFRVDCL